MQVINQTRSNTPLPPRMRPIVAPISDLLERHIRHLWTEIETNCDVELTYYANTREMMDIARDELPLFGAFDETRSYATTMYGFIGRRKGEPVMTVANAVYTLGSYDLLDYIERFGLFEGCPRITFNQAAKDLAVGIRGQASFAGNYWMARGLRGSPSGKVMTQCVGPLCRAIGLGTLNCGHYFHFIKDALVRRGIDTFTQHQGPGVIWEDSERWIRYSGERAIIDAASQAQGPDAPTPTRRH